MNNSMASSGLVPRGPHLSSVGDSRAEHVTPRAEGENHLPQHAAQDGAGLAASTAQKSYSG